MKHLLTLESQSTEEIKDILNLADQLKYELKHGIEHHHLKGKTLGMIIGGWCFFVTLFCCITGVYSTDMRTMILNICTPVVLIVLGMILPIIRQAQDKKEKGN